MRTPYLITTPEGDILARFTDEAPRDEALLTGEFADDAQPAYENEFAPYDTTPRQGESLRAYLTRVIDEVGCGGTHNHTITWSEFTGLGTSQGGLISWVQANGGCCCDCEVLANTLSPERDALVPAEYALVIA